MYGKITKECIVNKLFSKAYSVEENSSLPCLRESKAFINENFCHLYLRKFLLLDQKGEGMELIIFGSKLSLSKIVYFGVTYSDNFL